MSLDSGLKAADRLQGVLLLLVLVTVLAMVFIVSSLSADQRRNQEIMILEHCFSPPIVRKFVVAPESLERYFSRWMSVFFIDVVGFTSTTERSGSDLEGLALRLRRVMDIARSEIVVTAEGVVDKFIGDAVMGWIGGHFSHHFGILTPLRHELLFEELEHVQLDLYTLARGEKNQAAAGPPPAPVAGAHHEEVERLRARFDDLSRRQKELFCESPDLANRWAEANARYRRTVAHSAVSCMLRITEKIGSQLENDSFRAVKIGVASGDVCVGNFGSSDQIGFTIVGPTVNRAARFEPASGQCGCRILCDQETRDLVGDSDEIVFRRWGTVAVKGIAEGLPVHEPLRATAENRKLVETFHLALARVEEGDLAAAITGFERCRTMGSSGDAPSLVWIERLGEAIARGESSIGPFHAAK
jgi:class 3 adenylate cyclase